MEEPNTLMMVLRGFLIFLFALVLPQVCGVPSLRWAWRQHRKITLVPALLVAPAIFFVTAYVYWGMQADAIKEEGLRACGAFGAAAIFSTASGTAIHFFLSCAVLLYIWYVARRRNRFQERQ